MEEILKYIENNKLEKYGMGILSLLSANHLSECLELCKKNNISVWGYEAYELSAHGATGASKEYTKYFSESLTGNRLDESINYLKDNHKENIAYTVIFKNNYGDVKNFVYKNMLKDFGTGIKLISKEKFLELIELCKENQIEIIGFETFFLHGEATIQPSMALSPDISMYHGEQKLNEIIKFLNDRTEPNIGFEVYLKE